MNVSILTFQFAHNYGALLQAYALKTYIKTLGHNVEVAPYYPGWAQKEYAISPFTKGISVRKRLRFLVQYPKRKLLSDTFHRFQATYLGLSESFGTLSDLNQYLEKFDLIVFGSDQIWNDAITGDTSAYYGEGISKARISYAASLGTQKLTPVQKKHIKENLPHFRAISVREYTSEKMLMEVLDSPVTTVTDPVFLLSRSEWSKMENPLNVKNKFMLLYLLREDSKLVDYAKKYAKENDLILYEIHPTLARFHQGCIPLLNVGPQEFLWLINYAECICTNSFHTVSFSVIFRKRLLHIPHKGSPERTVSLLSYLGIDANSPEKDVPIYDLSTCDYSALNAAIEKSKDFLNQI